MTKLIAIHALHLASAVAGKIEQIEPGQSFDAREDELYLAHPDNGAARKATDDDKAATHITRAGASAAPAAGNTSGEGEPEDLTKLSKAQLIALADAEEITIDKDATKAVITQSIVDARAAKQDDLV